MSLFSFVIRHKTPMRLFCKSYVTKPIANSKTFLYTPCMDVEQYCNSLALFREISNLVQCYSANWSQTRGRKKISLCVSTKVVSVERPSINNALIEFITVCATVKATGDPDSTLSLHSQFKLSSLSYLRYFNLIEYSVKDVLHSHWK